jgi:hypothetical protein
MSAATWLAQIVAVDLIGREPATVRRETRWATREEARGFVERRLPGEEAATLWAVDGLVVSANRRECERGILDDAGRLLWMPAKPLPRQSTTV